MALADYELLIPYAEWKGRDWPSAIRDAEGVTKRVLQAQERAAHGIAGLPPSPTTPEKLAWVTLWARGFLFLQSAIDLQGQWSASIADYLYRIAFELWLQVAAIRDPWDRLSARRESQGVSISDARLNREWAVVTDRLRGFAAWALTNDLLYYRRRIRGSELNAVYAPTPPPIQPVDPVDIAVKTYLFGEQTVLSVNEAQADKAKAKEKHEATIKRLLDWLRDPAFGHWSEAFAPWITGAQMRELPTLYALFDPARPHIGDVLADSNAAFMYGSYARGSMLIHGSSIEHFTATSQGRIFPLVFTGDDEGERLCGHVADMCNHAMLGLIGMLPHCIPA